MNYSLCKKYFVSDITTGHPVEGNSQPELLNEKTPLSQLALRETQIVLIAKCRCMPLKHLAAYLSLKSWATYLSRKLGNLYSVQLGQLGATYLLLNWATYFSPSRANYMVLNRATCVITIKSQM